MYQEDDLIDRIFSQFGKAMYIAQVVEKGILDLILIEYTKKGITKWRYDELLYEKTNLTFGQLKRDLIALNCLEQNELILVEEFHKKRDFLTHNFWWERSVEFADKVLRSKLLIEFESYIELFQNVDRIIEDKCMIVINERNIDLDRIRQELFSNGRTPQIEQFRILKKDETIVDLYGYRLAEKSMIPIFKLSDNTFWTICEIGLTQFKEDIDTQKIIRLKKLEGIFPISHFKPRPQVDKEWNYNLDLKKRGLIVTIRRKSPQEPFLWSIKKIKNS